MAPTIQVRKDDEFFIAIFKYGPHSSVTLGVTRPGRQAFFLAAWGKGNYPRSASPLCDAAFGEVDAIIFNEPYVKRLIQGDSPEKLTRPRRKEVEYKAYGLTYLQYLQFLDYMAALSNKQQKKYEKLDRKYPLQRLAAYALVREDEQSATLEWQTLDNQLAFSYPLNSPENSLSFTDNTCRHSAIRLTEQARQTPGMLGQGISSFFWEEPPLKAVFGGGGVSKNHHFYILPLPPTAFQEITGEKKQLLIDIYNRLDEMVVIEQDNPLSIRKFDELKSLYQRIATQLPEDILQVIEAIEAWESSNLDLIKTHRRWYSSFFSFATKTEKMFNNFHRRFADIRKAGLEEEIVDRPGLT